MVDEMFEKFKDTRAIIFDMRGYPRGTGPFIVPRLTEKYPIAVARFSRHLVLSPEGPSGGILTQSAALSFVQSPPPTDKWRYKGRTVMLIDERAMSQAEHTGLAFEAANNTTFVGTPTVGANGDTTRFVVPGGILTAFSGQEIRHADGRQLQRIGLVPHLEVRPTIEGIRQGRDEVLEKAIEFVRKSTGDPNP